MISKASHGVVARKVSLPLAAGILLLPIVFAWFLLHRGYSKTARALGLSWLATFNFLILSQTSETRALKAASVEPQVATAKPSEPAAPGMPDTTLIQASSTPDRSVHELKRLYEQLQSFRRHQAFLDVGFDPCCRYHGWLKNLRALRDQHGFMVINGHKVVTGELETLAFEYMRNQGRSTKMASLFERHFEYALRPPKRSRGRGIVIEETRGCRNFELTAQFFRLAEEGAYSASDAVLNGPGCEEVGVGTRTGPVLARQSYKFRNGRAFEHVLVQLSNGRKVWLWTGEIEFH